MLGGEVIPGRGRVGVAGVGGSVGVGEPRRRCRGDRCGRDRCDELVAWRCRDRRARCAGRRLRRGRRRCRRAAATGSRSGATSRRTTAVRAATRAPTPRARLRTSGPCRCRLGLAFRGSFVARDRELDLVHLGARRRRFDRLVADAREVGLDRGTDPLAVARHVLVERVGVTRQRVATRAELGDLLFEPTAFALGDAARGGLGFADQRLRACFGLLDQLARVRLRLVDRVVGGALREEQRALQHLGVVAARGKGRRLVRGAALELLDLTREVLDGRGGALEEVVDLVTVEASEGLLDLAATELLRGDIHAGHGSDGPPGNRVIARRASLSRWRLRSARSRAQRTRR